MGQAQAFYTLLWAVLVCGGLFAAARPDGLLHGWTRRAKRWPKLIGYPFILCETCMASLWGTVVFIVQTLIQVIWHELPITWELLFWWPQVIIGCACCNHVLWTWVFNQARQRDHYALHGHALRDNLRRAQEGQGSDPQ